MKVLKDIPSEYCKITLFWWNQKYILKFEKYQLEQTFKISELDVTSQNEVEQLVENKDFIKKTLKRFEEMRQDISDILEY
jgi:hypothetical protein